jgi:ATP-dependent DNA helicase RecG
MVIFRSLLYVLIHTIRGIMSIKIEQLSISQAQQIINSEEGQFAELKSLDVTPAQLSKAIAAFSNTDGGDLYIGIIEEGYPKVRRWSGFVNPEAANGHLQLFKKLFPLGTDFQYEFLRADNLAGLVLHVQINKTRSIMRASNDLPYIRRGAQSLPVNSQEALKRLEYAKGLASFEDETTNVPLNLVTESDVTKDFITRVVPSAESAIWLKKTGACKGK